MQLARHRVSHFTKPGLFLRVLSLARGPKQRVPAVLNLTRDNLTSHGRAFRRRVRCAKVSAAKSDAGIRHAGDPRLEVAAFAEVIHGYAMFPAEIEHRRREGNPRPEGANRFEMMDGNGELPPIRRKLPRAFLGGQLGWIDWDFHLKG